MEHQAWSLVPQLFQDLVSQCRPYVLEITSLPESKLAQRVQERAGRASAAVRCADWNGHDLSTTEGIKHTLEKLEVLRPSHVWIQPPSQPFCNWQNTKSGEETQQHKLSKERQKTTKYLVGCSVIVGVCIQLGIHVSLQMPDQNNAWRLPVMQQMIKKHSLKTCVTKGCRMNKRGKDNKLSRRGWKVCTTHGRLSEVLHAPCTCAKAYVHTKDEGYAGSLEGSVTSEFIDRVSQLVMQEHNYVGVLSELQGKSGLPESFGGGLHCTCEFQRDRDSRVPCGLCLTGEQVGVTSEGEGVSEAGDEEGLDVEANSNLPLEVGEPEGTEEPHEQPIEETGNSANFCTHEIQQAEAKAQDLLRERHFKHEDCEALIELLPNLQQRGRKQAQGPQDPKQKKGYYTFGLYAHGRFFGITKLTRTLPQCHAYFQQYLQQQLPTDQKYTSYVVSRNMHMPLHRDCHNDPKYNNCVLGVSQYKGGELWIENTEEMPVSKSTVKVLPDGTERAGRLYETMHRTVQFPPKAWHGTEVWQGSRYVMSCYVSRSHTRADEECRSELRRLQFRIPPKPRQAGVRREHVLTASEQPLSKHERERVKKQLYLLHSATGHGSTKHLVEALRRRGVHPEVLALAKEFRCSVCEEKRRVQPRHLASLEPLPPKWHCISADIGHYYNVHKKEHVQFMMIVDEGSRFKAAKILTVGSKQQPTGAACLEYLRDGWISYFGAPRTLRLDPAGAFRGAAVEEFCDRHQIYLDVIPGEAHWKVSVVEQAVKGTKELLSKLLDDEPELDTREALAVAIRTFNQREIIRGFTPTQHALGQAPDITGRMDFSGKAPPPELLVENPSGELSRSIERQRTAEQALSEWQAKQRLSRAEHSRGRRILDFVPGELVFFWRSQVSGQSRREPGDRHGQFLGPARILATETKRDEQGHLMPSSSVWLVRGRSLIKCAAEQVRRASAREELIESLNQTDPVPWTYTRVAEQIGGSKYQDITESVPEQEWARAQDAEQEVQPTRRRIAQKRPQSEVQGPTTYDRAREDQATDYEPGQDHGRGRGPPTQRPSPYSRAGGSSGGQWWSEVQEALWSDDTAYWSDSNAAIEVEVALPESKQGLEKACRDLSTYFVQNMKKRAVEVSEKRLTDEEREQFRSAKMVEVKNFVAAQAFETIPEAQRPSKDQAVNMRWILTWKQKEDGTVKPKARAVLLGYQDPAYEHRATTAPVMSRQTRQLVLQVAANQNWRVAKGDVSGAFLQGRDYPDTLFCIPCPEICEALGIPAESITRLRRACYGLVDAPLEWYKTVDEFLGSLHLERTWSDACCWVLREQDAIVGIISGHVDDFLFTGNEQHPKWQATIKAIKERFKWGDWDYDEFVQCGVNVKRTSNGFELSQPRYVDCVKEIPVSASRRKQSTQATSDREKSQLRALLGAISWHAQQVAPHLSAEVSLLLSEVSQSDGETIAKANACLRRARANRDHVMKIHAFRSGEELGMYGWVDAGNQNRVDGYSTQGILIGLAPVALLQGELCPITPVAWHSNRIDRACRSPGAAEAHAAINGEDALYFARYQWQELLHGAGDTRDSASDVQKVLGCLITDSRNVYDKLETSVLSIKGAEKRTNIEMIALKESQEQTGLVLRWVHSEAQLANALTKRHNCKELELFYSMGHCWKIVEDPEMRSARRRRADGELPLSSKSG